MTRLAGLLTSLALLCGYGDARAGELIAGVATVEITPPVGLPMWGYAARHDAPATAVRDPLFAKAVVLGDGTSKIAIVGLDLGRPPTREHTAAIRERVAKAGIGHLFLVASHSHHGPILELDDRFGYTKQLTQKLGDLILEADRLARPARLGVGVKAVQLNRNRQSKAADAPVDRDLRVLRIEAADGTVIAHCVNFAAHPTTVEGKLLQWSADYPAVLARRVERESNAPCLFLQGASGDLSVQHPKGASGPEGIGDAIAVEVLELAKTIRVGPFGGSIKAARESLQFRCVVDVANPIVKLALGQAFFPALVGFYEKEYATGVRPELTVAMLGGDIGFAGFSGELFCSHAINLKRRARLPHLFVFGCCNDYQQYFPTIEAQAEGGYGTTIPVASSEIGAGERMADRALAQLYRLRGRLPQQ